MPNAEIVADRFHVMKKINEELDGQRKKERREISKIKDKSEKELKIKLVKRLAYGFRNFNNFNNQYLWTFQHCLHS